MFYLNFKFHTNVLYKYLKLMFEFPVRRRFKRQLNNLLNNDYK